MNWASRSPPRKARVKTAFLTRLYQGFPFRNVCEHNTPSLELLRRRRASVQQPQGRALSSIGAARAPSSVWQHLLTAFPTTSPVNNNERKRGVKRKRGRKRKNKQANKSPNTQQHLPGIFDLACPCSLHFPSPAVTCILKSYYACILRNSTRLKTRLSLQKLKRLPRGSTLPRLRSAERVVRAGDSQGTSQHRNTRLSALNRSPPAPP